MTRYSDIRRGAQLNQALQNYVNYLSTPRVPNVGGGTARGPQTQLFVRPFGQDIAATARLQVQAGTPSFTALNPHVLAATAAAADTALGTNTLVSLSKFRPSRIVWFRNATRVVTVATSEVTNSRYLKYSGERSSMPFGRANENDDEMDAFAEIKFNVLEGNANNEINRLSLTRERIGI